MLFAACKADSPRNNEQAKSSTKSSQKANQTAAIPAKHPKTKLVHELRSSRNNYATDPLLILLHGLGSNEGDMAKLALNLNGNYHIASLRAPITMGQDKNTWYAYGPQANPKQANKQMDRATKQIMQTINQIQRQYKLKPSKILIGGFSQGAIMSYHTALSKPAVFAGVLPMSGRLSDYTRSLVDPTNKSYKNLDFHITHGTDDQRILYTDGQKAYHLLRSKGIKATFKPYKGGHNIAKECYESINETLGNWN